MAPRVDRAVRSLPCQSSIPGRYDLLRTTRKERLEPHRATHDLRVRGLAYHPNLRPTAKRGHMRPAEDGRRVAHLCIAPSPRRVPHPCVFCKGGRRCCRRNSGPFYTAPCVCRRRTSLRKVRDGRGTWPLEHYFLRRDYDDTRPARR